MSNLKIILREKVFIQPILIPTFLSLSRLLILPVFFSYLISGDPLAFPFYLLACATDLLDGKLARLLKVTSHKGAVLDAFADFLLVAAGFSYYIALGFVSELLLVVMTASFLQYILTAKKQVRDSFGKHVGTVLYVLLAVMILFPGRATGIGSTVIGVIYIFASFINRFNTLRKHNQQSFL